MTPTRAETDTRQPESPAERWATFADQLDPRLLQQPDWAATAGALQLVEDRGHDVTALTATALAHAPLGDRPAQDLRYRLAHLLDVPSRSRLDRDLSHRPEVVGSSASPENAPSPEPNLGSAGVRAAERDPSLAGPSAAPPALTR